MKKISLVAIILAISVLFVGCSDEKSNDKKRDAKTEYFTEEYLIEDEVVYKYLTQEWFDDLVDDKESFFVIFGRPS